VSVGVLALIILFQEEIRRFFLTLGSQRRLSVLTRFFIKHATGEEESEEKKILPIVMACDYMSKNFVGALIIIRQEMSLIDIENTGETIDANINAQLIKNIFFKNSPLHDGAMIIDNNRITSAACILPVSHNTNIPKELGLRHRAALGITQQSDAIAIIVSEETGQITMSRRGEFKRNISTEELERYLSTIMK
jgi:uncharacterized protein (TIGR00159 family)